MPKLPLLLVLLLPVSATWVSAMTEVCGTFSLATEWTIKESPYLVTGDIFIPATSRLRIGPGVVVRFARPKPCPSDKAVVTADPDPEKHSHAAHASHENASENAGNATPGLLDWADSTYTGIKAEGTLYVLGSEEQPVIFEPDDKNAGSVGWDGIRLWGQQAGAAEISFSVFRGANQAITVEKANFVIHHTLFEGNNTGIFTGLRGDVSIINCNFIGNLSAGIVIRKGSPRIANNIFADNKSYGIWGDGRPAIQTWNNAFWANREEACFKCPYAVLEPDKTNANKDTTDKSGNLSADPLFVGSASHKAAIEADVLTETPAHLIKDPAMAKLEADARAEETKTAKKKKNKKTVEFVPLGTGPYILSKYSKLVNAGHPGKDFRDRDGSANDIGLHGGPMGRITSDPF